MGALKIALVYNPLDTKLVKASYSCIYRGQFLALKRLGNIIDVTKPCNAKDIDADVIIFYDVHSAYHSDIDGIADHPAVKYEYFNDPHQLAIKGVYQYTGKKVCKLGAKERTQRALDRGVDFIICPFPEPYYEYLAPYLGNKAKDMLVWFPPAPDIRLYNDRFVLLKDRHQRILGNGSITETPNSKGYQTREWAHRQPYIFHIPHVAFSKDHKTPSGENYPKLLAVFAASIAITDDHIVPKHLEIPLAGCVCFASGHQDYKNMGFKDGENCYFVDKSNFKDKAEYFLKHIEEHQSMADAGRKLIEENWTADHFARFIYNHSKGVINAR